MCIIVTTVVQSISNSIVIYSDKLISSYKYNKIGQRKQAAGVQHVC